MHCPDVGTWRAWLDRELDEQPFNPGDHLVACADCRTTVDELRDNAAVATAAVGGLGPAALPSAIQVERAHRRLTAREPVPPGRQPSEPIAESPEEKIPATTRARSAPRWRIATAGLAAALALTFLVATPQGQAAAAAFLAQFRSQRLQVVTIDPDRARNPLLDLERLGTLAGDRRPSRPEEVATIAEASRRVGFDVKQPDPATLPPGVDRSPKILVSRAGQARFTFDRDKARAYFQSVGKPQVALPDRFHGATLVVNMPATVMLRYPGPSQQDIGLGVVQAGEVTANVEGRVSLEELRDFLLDLPDLPPDTAEQLRGIRDWRNTLPIPVPPNKINWQSTTIAGRPGYVLADTSVLASAAIWQRDGVVYGVVGGFKPDVVLRVAESLHR